MFIIRCVCRKKIRVWGKQTRPNNESDSNRMKMTNGGGLVTIPIAGETIQHPNQ